MAVSICAAEGIDGGRGAWLADGRADRIRQLIAAGLNCPLTSSAGRLFDAAAALLDLCDTAGYEAQGAIRLETAAAHGVIAAYPFDIDEDGRVAVLDLGPAFRALVRDAGRGVDRGVISAKFHNGVVAATAALAGRLCAARGLRDVVLSGGVFQNRLVLSGLTAALRSAGLTVHVNSSVPCNDAGISLGQAAVALALMQGERTCA
jgi:hydrogenase maturation protein HypF